MALTFLYDEDSRELSERILRGLTERRLGHVADAARASLMQTESAIEQMLDHALAFLAAGRTVDAMQILFYDPTTTDRMSDEGAKFRREHPESKLNDAMKTLIALWFRDGYEPHAPLNLVEALFALFHTSVVMARVFESANESLLLFKCELIIGDEAGNSVFDTRHLAELHAASTLVRNLFTRMIEEWNCSFLLRTFQESKNVNPPLLQSPYMATALKFGIMKQQLDVMAA